MNKNYSSLKNNINVHYYGKFLDKKTSDEYFKVLEENVVYNTDKQSQIIIFGKKITIPRKQVAFGDVGTSYKFAGVTVQANPWTGDDLLSKTLLKIKDKVELFTGKTFNFVLLNRYKDGESYIGAHRDDEKELGDEPTIAAVSFGAKRELVFAPYKFIPLPDILPLVKDKIHIPLEHGSLCVMLNKTNTYWTHCLPKNPKIAEPRISLTFRYINL